METSSEEQQQQQQSIMSEEYLHSIGMSLVDAVEAKGTELCKEEGLDMLLKHYITGDHTELLTSEKANLLATALLLYDIPSKHIVQLQANSKSYYCTLQWQFTLGSLKFICISYIVTYI